MISSEHKAVLANKCLDNCPKQVSEEKVQGVLENVFGLKLPKKIVQPPTIDEDKVADTLINVFGLKLPSEMIPNAYSLFLQEHSR